MQALSHKKAMLRNAAAVYVAHLNLNLNLNLILILAPRRCGAA
jgi:hypothetical protein